MSASALRDRGARGFRSSLDVREHRGLVRQGRVDRVRDRGRGRAVRDGNLNAKTESVDKIGAPKQIEWSLYSVKMYLTDAIWSLEVSY